MKESNCLGAGQLGAGLHVGWELCVVVGQIGGGIGYTGNGIGSSLGNPLGQDDGLLDLQIQSKGLSQRLHSAASGDRGFLDIFGAGANR